MTTPEKPVPDHRLCVAPMMAYTDRDFRFFLRLISRRVMLYTEMVATGALLHGDGTRRLAFHPAEHPVGVQLGGADPGALANCARLAAQIGYDEVNLNVGCPSERVSHARIGACLMAEPDRVAECVAAMAAAAPVPVTVKTRIGIDSLDGYDDLRRFICTVEAAGCRTFILHARKAWLNGLSPRENREAPPLRHDVVHRIKQDFPQLRIVINGGIETLDQARAQLARVDGAMMGRSVCANPYLLAFADAEIFGLDAAPSSRIEVLRQYMEYVEDRLHDGVPLHLLARHLPGLFHGQRGARRFRRLLGERTGDQGVQLETIREALVQVSADQPPAAGN